MGVNKRPFLSRTCTVTCWTHVKRDEPSDKKILNQFLPNTKVLFVKLQIHTTSCLVLRLHFLWSIHCLEQKLSSSRPFALFGRVGGVGGGGRVDLLLTIKYFSKRNTLINFSFLFFVQINYTTSPSTNCKLFFVSSLFRG